MLSIQQLWQSRAKLFGDSMKSVMEQSFPLIVNEIIHAIHVEEIMHAMPTEATRVLDVGCGWGRIAADITKQKKVFVSGVDISKTFVALFNRRLKGRGKAVASNMQKLPFKENTFDCVYCVVSLMYLSFQKDQTGALSEMLRVLKPRGRLILIEPNKTGVSIVRLGGFIPFFYRTLLRKKKVETYGIAFHLKDLENRIDEAGGKIFYRKGYPFLTLVLLPSVIIGKIFPTGAKLLLHIARSLDRSFPNPDFSYFVTWSIHK